MTVLGAARLLVFSTVMLLLAACSGGPVRLENPFFGGKSCITPGMYYGAAYCPPPVIAENAKAPVYCYRTLAQTDCYSEPKVPEVGVLGGQNAPQPVTDPAYWPPRSKTVFDSPAGPMDSPKQAMVAPSGAPLITPAPGLGPVTAQSLPPPGGVDGGAMTYAAPQRAPRSVTPPAAAPAPASAPAPMPMPTPMPTPDPAASQPPGQNFGFGG
jgi:hypothetical protein